MRGGGGRLPQLGATDVALQQLPTVTAGAAWLIPARVEPYWATRSRRAVPASAASPCTVNDLWMPRACPGPDPATTRTSHTPGAVLAHRSRDPFRPGCRRCSIPVTGLHPYSCRDCDRDGAGHQCRGGARTAPLPGTSRGALGGIRTPGLQIHTDPRAVVRQRRTCLDLRIGASTVGSHTQCYAPSCGQIRPARTGRDCFLIR